MTYRPKNPLAAACAVLIFCSFAAWGHDTATFECPQSLAATIPERSPAAKSASDLLQMLVGVDEDKREAIIRDEILAGNVPRFLRRPTPVVVRPQSAGSAAVTLCVLPDYVSIGSEADFVIVPMQLKTALAVARQYGFVLPTPRIVDVIYEQAAVHLTPQPLPPGERMRTTNYFWRHNDLVGAQRAAFGKPPGMLIAGHKKDLVLTNRLWDHADRVAIYGWHRTDHRPIQPLSTVHGERYADYSHGVRLVSQTAYVDGRATPLLQLLEDPEWSASLSNEGPIRRAANLMRALAERSEGHGLRSMVLQQRKPR